MDTDPPIVRQKSSWSRIAVRCLYLGFLVASIVWMASAADPLSDGFSFKGQKRGIDYYNLLVDGFLEGHTYMKVEVNPGLLSSDPDVRAKAPTLLDANFYNGHFYLYYGVVPAAVLFLPYSAITGHDLSPNAATALFVVLGFLFSAQLFYDLKRQKGWTWSPFFTALALLVLAFAPATLFLVRRSLFYEIPLACGYACVMGMMLALQRAISRKPSGTGYWILVSIAFGLAVGCHPNYLFLGPALAFVGWRHVSSLATDYRFRYWASLVFPAALIGGLLAGYNYARFGNPFEFGFRYGQNGFFSSGDRMVGLEFIPPNLKWYYLTPPTVTAEFPFIFPADASFRPKGYHGAEDIHGQFAVTLLCCWTLLGLGLLRRGNRLGQPTITVVSLYSAAVGIAFICILGIRANRYQVDGQAPLVLATVLIAGGIWSATRGRGTLVHLWKFGWGVSAIAAVLSNVCGSIQQFDQFMFTRPKTFSAASAALNPSWSTLDKIGLVRYPPGPLVLDVVFQPQTKAVFEPLLTTGTPSYSDCVYAIQHTGNLLQFHVDHRNYNSPLGELQTIVPGKKYTVEIDIGSLYPPRNDPFYDHYTAVQRELIKTSATVKLDGKVVYSRRMAFYESPPWVRRIGKNDISISTGSIDFSGEISNVRVLPLGDPRERETEPNPTGVYKFLLTFPSEPLDTGFPLLAGGATGHGALLYVVHSKDGYKFSVDEWGAGAVAGPGVEISPGEHSLEIVVGPLVVKHKWTAEPAYDLGSLQRRVILLLDGKIVTDLPVRSVSDVFEPVSFGTNIQGFSHAMENFPGEFRQVPVSEEDALALLGRLR